MGGRLHGAQEVMAEQSTGRGARGVVAAAAPVAAAIGAELLRAGGNAFDAVVAAALAETVLLPPKCGLGGDLVALWFGPDAGEPQALIAVGGAPRGLAAAAEAGGLPATGPLSVGVPSAAAGYSALAERGRFTLSELTDPARTLADEGFVWTQICTVLAEESAQLVARHTPGPNRYYPEGRPIEPGEIVRLPGLARVLEEFAARGAAMLEGPVGAAIVATVQAAGGVLTSDDFEFASAQWCPTDRITIGGTHIWATPAPTHGPVLLDALASRSDDDDVADVWRRFHSARLRQAAVLGDPAPTGTSMVSAADADGNAVVVVHSNSFPRFGSGLVVDGYDLILNNRAGRGFVAEPGHPGSPVAGRRPPTTLHAWAAGEASGATPSLLGATPGGINQVPWNLQMVESLLRGQSSPGHLVTEPRWEWLNDPSGVRLEEGLGDAAFQAFEEIEDRVLGAAAWSLRSAQQVVRVPRVSEAREAAVDPRTGGAVVGV